MSSTIVQDVDLTRAARSGAAQRILIAIHGHEPDGWAHALRAAIPRTGVVRVLVVEGAPVPALTSLLPAARGRYSAARRVWEREGDERRAAVLDAIVPCLPESADVARIPAGADPGRTIAAYASDWPADVVVVGRDGRPRLERAVAGTVHERVVDRAPCAVLVVRGSTRPPAPRGVRLPWRAAARGGV